MEVKRMSFALIDGLNQASARPYRSQALVLFFAVSCFIQFPKRNPSNIQQSESYSQSITMGWYRDRHQQDSFQASDHVLGSHVKAAVCTGVLQIDVPNRTLVHY